jgi:hypothetical protein
MTPSALDELWAELPPATGIELSGKRVPGFATRSPVYVAIDSRGHRHLLIEVETVNETFAPRGTRGLTVHTEVLRVRDFDAAPYIDLECIEKKHDHTFAAFASDLLGLLKKAKDRRKTVVSCLQRWRSFWLVDQTGLSREAALGLFGELWLLARWLKPLTAPKLEGWQGPNGARHDFQWQHASVEVKTSAIGASGTAIHYISSLDQLGAPEQGHLFLFSLHVTDDALAANDVPSLVRHISELLQEDEETLASFSFRLAAAGYSPAHAEYYRRPLRIVAEDLYLVEGGFPRLTRQSFERGIPVGIQEISYCLSMAACVDWRVANAPVDVSEPLIAQKLAAAIGPYPKAE